jgi:hypothetical protein
LLEVLFGDFAASAAWPYKTAKRIRIWLKIAENPGSTKTWQTGVRA